MTEWKKNAVVIPVTREAMEDAGYIGPLGDWDDPEAERWRKRWHDRPTDKTVAFSDGVVLPVPRWIRTPPPWEVAHRNPMPEFTVFGPRVNTVLRFLEKCVVRG